MIRQAVDSVVPAENASRFQQPLGIPFGFPTDPKAPTTTGYSWCPFYRAGPALRLCVSASLRLCVVLRWRDGAMEIPNS